MVPGFGDHWRGHCEGLLFTGHTASSNSLLGGAGSQGTCMPSSWESLLGRQLQGRYGPNKWAHFQTPAPVEPFTTFWSKATIQTCVLETSALTQQLWAS